MEIYLRYVEKYGSSSYTFEWCYKEIELGKNSGNYQQTISGGSFYYFGNVENTLVLSQLNDEILQRCDKEVIVDSLLDVPVDVMVEEVATYFIPNSVNTIFGSTSDESNTISG